MDELKPLCNDATQENPLPLLEERLPRTRSGVETFVAASSHDAFPLPSSPPFPRCHPRTFPLLSSSTLVIEDPSFCFLLLFCRRTPARAISWRPLPAPQSRNLVEGEDCLSEASSAAQEIWTGQRHPKGHAIKRRLWPHKQAFTGL